MRFKGGFVKDIQMIDLDHVIPGLEGKSFGQFWRWAYSDTLSNGNRSVFAEYIVGVALGVVDRPRREWHRTDLLHRDHVFCLYPEKDRDLCDVSNVNQWEFYIISKSRLEEIFPNHKTIWLWSSNGNRAG